MNAERLESNGAGPQGLFGAPVETHASIGSTNDEAFRRAAEGAPEGLIVLAGAQTAGRGRQGRAWWDAPGCSLLFSALLRPRIPLPQYPLLALAMACAVAEAGEEATGAPLALKWPNDVLHAGRKLCGVLAESRTVGESASSRGSGSAGASRASGASGASGSVGPLLVIGAGVNVNQLDTDFPPELRGRATSLRSAAGGGRRLEPRSVLAAVLRRFERYLGLAQRGDAANLWAAVTPRLPERGTRLAVTSGGVLVEGIVEGITETGALQLREDGREGLTVVSAGEIA